MAPTIAYTLPAMQLVCSLIMPGTQVSNNTDTDQIGALPAGYVAYPEIGVAYKIYKTKETWKVARERCIEEGAHLAVIDTNIKFEYLLNQSQSTDKMHVGIYSMYDNTAWVSVSTGSILTNLPWAAGDPSGSGQCVSTYTSPRGIRNYPCSNQDYYACELPVPRDYNARGNLVAQLSAH